jgi:hypothetical protein
MEGMRKGKQPQSWQIPPPLSTLTRTTEPVRKPQLSEAHKSSSNALAYLEASHGFLGLSQLASVLQGEHLLPLVHDVAQILQHRLGRQKGGCSHIDVQGQPILAGPQALLVPQPHLQCPLLVLLETWIQYGDFCRCAESMMSMSPEWSGHLRCAHARAI